jgi:hypothetical protein
MLVETRASRLHWDRGASENLAHVVKLRGREEFKRGFEEPGTSGSRHCLVPRNIATEPVVQAVSQKAFDWG